MPVRKLKNRVTARKKKATKKTASARKHVGDVLGLGPAKPPSKPIQSAGKPKRPKGVEIVRKRKRTILRPARVRG